MFGTGELIVLVLVVLLVFGAAKIPQLGKALGEGIRNFKKATHDDAIDVTPPPPKLDDKKPGS
ncbi:MAG: twin-arginine translocase TatA/TatE family subunit [Deltaproteobacteria bacterium]|nr:twin-arginine translocase TatA/TatE family subunit [Deltaproteobacteria bacterium]